VDNTAYLTLLEMENEEEIKKVVKGMEKIKRDDVQVLLTFGALIRANEISFIYFDLILFFPLFFLPFLP
jgi:hypothetical protein